MDPIFLQHLSNQSSN